MARVKVVAHAVRRRSTPRRLTTLTALAMGFHRSESGRQMSIWSPSIAITWPNCQKSEAYWSRPTVGVDADYRIRVHCVG